MLSTEALARVVTDETEKNVAPWLVRLARIGEAAFGVVFIVIGALAVEAAVGAGGTTTDAIGALHAIRESRFGSVALIVMGVGLLGFALWSVMSAILDADREGRDVRGMLARIGHALRGVAYALLGAESLRQLKTPDTSGGHQEAQWTARALDLPFGRAIVIVVALLIAAYALYQIRWAFSPEVRRRLETATDSALTRFLVILGRFGNMTMGALIVLIAALLFLAAVHHRTGEAAGLDESLARLATARFGVLLLGAAALGLVCFGVYEIASAKYRRLPVTELQRVT